MMQRSVSKRTTAELNHLKFEYLFNVSGTVRVDVIRAYIADCVRFYKLHMADDTPGADDACILAAMGLLKVHDVARKNPGNRRDPSQQQELIQAACLLDFLLVRNPDNRQAMLLSVRINSRLGLISAAMRRYRGLKVKEIMNETLSHMCFTRVSTTHPHSSTTPQTMQLGQNERDPYLALKAELKARASSITRIQRFTGEDLSSMAYDQVFEFRKLKTGLERSLVRQMWILERRRIARLRAQHYDDDDDLFDELAGTWITLSAICWCLTGTACLDNSVAGMSSCGSPEHGLTRFSRKTPLYQSSGKSWIYCYSAGFPSGGLTLDLVRS